MDWENAAAHFEAYFVEHKAHFLDVLRTMVGINSYTENPQGVNRLGEATAEVFAPLGFEAEYVQSVNPGFGKHLCLSRAGKSSRKIGMISHLDTVFSQEEEERNDFHWREEGDRIYGPGTIDIKGGTVMIYMILRALEALAPDVYDAFGWEILLDASEEDDAYDFGELCLARLGTDAVAGLVFECGLLTQEKDFLLVVARKGRAIFKVSVEGKASHAGTNHHRGANAIVQLAHIVQEISLLTDYDKEVTVNVGSIQGGTVPNRVPHHAEALLEMRAFSREVYQETVDALMSLNGVSHIRSFDGDFFCRVSVELVRETVPWPRNAETDALFARWSEVGKALGYNAVEQLRGGLSDGNLICHQVPVLDGLGPSGANAHCSEHRADGSKEQEYLTVSSLIPKALINTLALMNLIEDKG